MRLWQMSVKFGVDWKFGEFYLKFRIKGEMYCFDAKPFNLTACFIMKCDTKCYDYALKMAGHEQ